MMKQKRYLLLADGSLYEGRPFGADKEALCELVFATGMTGYMETLTDKSYRGQGVAQTFPLVGNYGAIPPDAESERPQVSAYIVRELCSAPSNFRSAGALDVYLRENGVPGLSGVDTRALTRRIREKGVMNGLVTDAPERADMDALRAFRVENAVAEVSVKSPEYHDCPGCRFTVALYDYGYKKSILRALNARGCGVWLLPHDTAAQTAARLAPDGVMLSNGPGDPADEKAAIAAIGELRAMGTPIFGICLGHQLLALSEGFETRKMKYGHRGVNQAVKRAADGRVFITSQNHGYAVAGESVDGRRARVSYLNVNDGSCEGLEYADGRAFSVQFHPEACAGPEDTAYLFDDFIAMMEGAS